MILGLLAMIVANAAAALAARSLLERVRVGRPSTDLLLFLTLRLLLISAVVLVAGAARLLTPPTLGLAGAAVLAALLARGAPRGLLPASRSAWDRWVIAAAAVVAVRLLLQVWFLAPNVGDALSYHLPKVAEWVRAGALTSEVGADPRAAFPAGFELIEIWWVVFLHHDVLIEMAGLEFLALAGAAAYALARELGWSEKVASLAALIFVLTPGLHLQATACLNDAPVAALVAATAALVVARVHPLLLLLPVGLGVGVKPTFVYALPGLAITAWLLRRRDGAPPPFLRAAAPLAAAALGVGAVWYLRNWVLHGSPFHPLGADGMKSLATGATMQRLGPSLRALRENLACFLDIRVYDRVQAADPLCAGNFNWGAAAFALGAPALVFLLRSEPALRALAAGLAVSALSVFTLVELDPWYARFVLFLPLLTSLALARMTELHRGAALLTPVALALGFLATFASAGLPRNEVARLARQSWSARAANPPPMPDDGSPIGYVSDAFGSGYSIYGPGFSHPVVVLRDKSLEELLRHAERERIAIFFVDGPARRGSPMLEDGVRRGLLEPFARSGWQGYRLVSAR
jgi:hypothetical protein